MCCYIWHFAFSKEWKSICTVLNQVIDNLGCISWLKCSHLSALSNDNPVKSKKLRYSDATNWLNSLLQEKQKEGLWVCVSFYSLSYTIRSFIHKHSLLAQVSCHVTALEALQIEQSLGQSFGSICVNAAAISESICAAPFQRVHAAQLRVRVAQHICEVGITVETNMKRKKHQFPDEKSSQMNEQFIL